MFGEDFEVDNQVRKGNATGYAFGDVELCDGRPIAIKGQFFELDPTYQMYGTLETGCGTRPSGVPGAAVAVARRTAGRQIGGAFGRRSSISDKNIGFWEIETSSKRRESQFVAWVGATCALGTSRFLLGSISPECATASPERQRQSAKLRWGAPYEGVQAVADACGGCHTSRAFRP